jgi:hypothetical protein
LAVEYLEWVTLRKGIISINRIAFIFTDYEGQRYRGDSGFARTLLPSQTLP